MKSKKNENFFINLSKSQIKRLKRNIHDVRLDLIMGATFGSTREEQKVELLKLKKELIAAKEELEKFRLEEKEFKGILKYIKQRGVTASNTYNIIYEEQIAMSKEKLFGKAYPMVNSNGIITKRKK